MVISNKLLEQEGPGLEDHLNHIDGWTWANEFLIYNVVIVTPQASVAPLSQTICGERLFYVQSFAVQE